MRDRPRAYGPFKHGKRWRVHFVTGRGTGRSTTYETFDTWDLAERCKNGATDEAQGVTVRSAVEKFIENRKAKGRAPLTIVAYTNRLEALLGRCMSRPIRYLAGRGEELYLASRAYGEDHQRTGERRVDTHRNLLRVGRMLGAFCVKQRWLKANPFQDVEPLGERVHGSDKARLTVDESRKLEAWCVAHAGDVEAVLTLAYLYLGVRASELVKRDVRDVDDSGRLLWIRKTKTRAGDRRLQVPEPLASMLVDLTGVRPADAPLFVVYGKRITTAIAYKRVMAVTAAAGIPSVSSQTLRRTSATLATEAGLGGPAVAAFLGHGSVAIAKQSYVGREAGEQAAKRKAWKVLDGGKK
ncbi:MAG TPA: tyrosine-type recombinase/integrase [Kofleriaceae bacterium]|nr:tyrosine-type recombinase/integrase [Kofleriaceae bacterium]